MTWVIVAAALAAGVEWRRLAALALALVAPLPFLGLVALLWWRARPGLSTRAVRFCEAVSAELRSGASMRQAVEKSALSVDAPAVARLCREGAPMTEVARTASTDFDQVGPELAALLALALAQVEVAHEVSIASAPARATGAVLLLAAVFGVGWALTRGGVEPFLRHPAQRAAVILGAGLVVSGLALAILILRRAR
jgi:hypothetical protein